jgi:NTP pyrophosphatase (non-canonical NTP hydrolase)
LNTDQKLRSSQHHLTEAMLDSPKPYVTDWRSVPVLGEAQAVSVNAVVKERQRQIAKFGDQGHTDDIWFLILSEEVGEVAQARLHDLYGGRASGTLKEELTQVAAVALAWLEHLERKAAL